MVTFLLRPLRKFPLAFAAFCGTCVAGSVVFESVPAQALAFNPAYTVSNIASGTSIVSPSSFGFFFDTQSEVQLNGLGFASQPGWANGTSYEITLWSYANGGSSPTDYTVVASKTFTEGQSYTLQDGYYWQNLIPVILGDTSTGDPSNLAGYVISAIGDFSGSNGAVQVLGGTASFNSEFLNSGNGFNDASDPLGYFPVPIFDGGVAQRGYFNANLSIASNTPSVPGPLPLFGVAAGFAWSRRLRKRIRSTK